MCSWAVCSTHFISGWVYKKIVFLKFTKLSAVLIDVRRMIMRACVPVNVHPAVHTEQLHCRFSLCLRLSSGSAHMAWTKKEAFSQSHDSQFTRATTRKHLRAGRYLNNVHTIPTGAETASHVLTRNCVYWGVHFPVQDLDATKTGVFVGPLFTDEPSY